MNDNSKMPSWLQDKKKLVIIGLVVLAMIVSGFTNLTIARSVIRDIIEPNQYTSAFEGKLKHLFKSNKLNGTYNNIYASESMTFGKDGSLIYSYDDELVFGTYELEDEYLTITLDSFDYVFDIVENDGNDLVVMFNGYEYYYEKAN